MTHIHFIGIGGSGLSAIARLLLESGYTVSGSDRALTPFADEVRHAGATVYVGHHPRNIAGADSVVMSSASTSGLSALTAEDITTESAPAILRGW